jgi:HSP20 family protein
MLLQDNEKTNQPEKGGLNMRRDLSRTQTGQAQRLPAERRSGFFSPLFEDYFEPARWFDDFFNREMSRYGEQARFLSPAIDIDETDNEYVVSADLPGIKKEDIQIECSGHQLTISAERKSESTEGRKQERRERFYGTFQRSFTLPSGVDADKIQADYEGGVLTVRIPKGEEIKSKRIQIGEGKTPEATSEKH